MKAAFETIYGDCPRWIARAPGRVNLIGEHTDYNEGFVLPMAIERHITIAAAPNGTDAIVLRSTAFDDAVRIELSQPIVPGEQGSWANYPKGVIAGFIKAGHAISGFNALIDSNVPMGGGLSSSAALEVATATLLEAVIGKTLVPKDKALLCQAAEHEYAGMPCGIMDQYISTLARKDTFLLLDCREFDAHWVQADDPSVAVLIFDTKIKHKHSRGEYAARRRECKEAAQCLGVSSLRDVTLAQLEMRRDDLKPILFRRARHIVTENERTIRACARIRNCDWTDVGAAMYASHASLCTDFEVSCLELNTVVEIAREIGPEGGVYGCRMTGGGFGGCAVVLIRKDAEYTVIDTMYRNYFCRTGVEPSLFVSRPAQGAQLLEC